MAEADLAILLEARLSTFERQMKQAYSIADRNFRAIDRRARQSASSIEKYFTRMGTGAIASFTGTVSVRAAQQLIDASIRIGNSLKVAGLAGKDLEKVYKSLFASAQRNVAPLESLAQLYSRVALVQGELGASTDDMLKFTDNVALALRVAGADAQSASGALLQLSQAMGSGTVRAEEFNSILEGALPIAQAAAAGLKEAGGSVAKLRSLVVDGKISSQAFFDAFQAGSVTLEDKVASAETTVSASFVRLQNVLIDAAGRFNETSSAGQRFASFLDTLGAKVTDFVNSPAFDSALNDLGDAMAKTFANDMRDIQHVIDLVTELASHFDRYGASISDAEIELNDAAQAVANLATLTKGKFGEVDDAFQDLVQQLLEGRGTAELAAEAIEALGDANPDFAALQDKIAGVIENFIRLRDAANAAYAAAAKTDAVGPGATWQELTTTFKPATPVQTVTLEDYPITPGAGSGRGNGGGGGGHRRSAGAMREERDAAKELIEELQAELRMIGLSDVEKRIDTELRRAGANATDAQKESIRSLVTEIEGQNAAMDRMQSLMDGAKGLAKDFLGGLIGDLRNGVDGATALANAFSRLADKLIDMALDSLINSLFDNLLGGLGGGLFGGALGFSDGGMVKAATGGLIRGPGTGTSDSVPARLSNGEYVVKASQTAKHLDLLHAINEGRVAAFATGGLVGDGPAIRAANGNISHANGDVAPVVTINSPITVNGSAGTPEQNQDLAKKMRREMEAGMRSIVADELRKQQKSGNTLNTRSR